MDGGSVGVGAVILRARVVIDVIAELISQPDGILVRVINSARRLMPLRQVECFGFGGVAMPVISALRVGTIHVAGAVPGFAIERIECSDAVHKNSRISGG